MFGSSAIAVLVTMAMGLMAASATHQDSFNIGKVAHSKDDAYYNFRYAVDDDKSGVVADRWESRSGRFVKGAYSLLGPDGKVRSVHYEVDGDHGFKAVVRTDPPRLNLLSIQSAREVRLTHSDPPINKELVEAPQVSPGEKPYNYHARPDPIQQRSALPSSALLTFAAVPTSFDSSLFSNDLIQRPSIDDEDLQALQDLTPPAIDAFARTYDTYPRPVRTNPNRRQQEYVEDGHRTVYSDYVNKQLQRISPSSPQRSARLARFPVASRGSIPVAAASPVASPEAPAKRNDQVTHQPAPFSRYWNRPRQFLRETSPYASSYFL